PNMSRYRVEIRVAEMQGQTKLNSRSYRFFPQRNETQKLNIAERSPSQKGSQAASDDKDKTVQQRGFYQDFDCTVTSESEHAVGLIVRGSFWDPSSGNNGTSSDNEKDVRQVSIEVKPTVELD